MSDAIKTTKRNIKTKIVRGYRASIYVVNTVAPICCVSEYVCIESAVNTFFILCISIDSIHSVCDRKGMRTTYVNISVFHISIHDFVVWKYVCVIYRVAVDWWTIGATYALIMITCVVCVCVCVCGLVTNEESNAVTQT